MKILVTGGGGFIGRHMYHALAQHEVRSMEWGDPFPDVQDLDWVIHLGAISSTTERDVEKVLNQNLDFSTELLDRCIHAGVNLQYASSASIYGLGADFRETAPADPRTPYAWSKYLFERVAAKRKTDTHIHIQGFRYFNVFGAGEERKGEQASPYCKFAQSARDHKPILLFENSERYRRDFVPVEVVIATHLQFLTVPESGVWNIGSGKAISFADVADTFDCKIEIIPMPENLRQSYQAYTCADLAKLRETLARYDLSFVGDNANDRYIST